MESDLIPYTASQGLNARAVLVLAPHPDDEVFGCGGAIAGHVLAGVPVQVVILTDGALFGDSSVRYQECLAAAAVLGYGQPDFWALPDRGLTYSEALVQRVVDVLKASGADLVYAPSPWEVHPDHRQTSTAAIQAVRLAGVRIAFYEVGSPLRPNLLLNISAYAATKQRAMLCFASQQLQQDYASHIAALNFYRTYTLPREVTAAEAFLVLSAVDLTDTLSGLLAAHPVLLAAVPSASASGEKLPLVSVMIRSMDREYLQQALDSVALQTYPHIEVVVLAAHPGHQSLPSRCGPFELRLIPTDSPLLRSPAANHAMDHARGEYLLFLDDDDWLLPGHIARLAQVLRHQPTNLAAYTGVALVASGGQPQGQIMDLPYDAIRLLAGNVMPIHAVLFSCKLLALGCRFDESLDLHEDWDFWLQVARHTVFAHVPGVSAVYRMHGSSGVHNDNAKITTSIQTIFDKWQTRWNSREAIQVMQRVRSHDDLELQLASKSDAFEKVEAALDQQRITAHQSALSIDLLLKQADQRRTEAEHDMAVLEHKLALAERRATDVNQQLVVTEDLLRRLECQKAELLNSRSWRVTQPLRQLANLMRVTINISLFKPTVLLQYEKIHKKDMETSLVNLFFKTYLFWCRYGTRATIKRIRAELGPKPAYTPAAYSVPAIPPSASPRSAAQLSQARFESLTPLSLYMLPPSPHKRITIVTDSIARNSLFGGVGTALIFATLLANRLGADLRVITRTERPQPDNVDHILSVYGLALKGEIQFKFLSVHERNQSTDFTESELFITTSWWTTASTLGSVPASSILYLLQEDERMFYPFGDDRLRCEEILGRRDIRFLINTKLLFDHLVANGLPNIADQGTWFEPAFPTRVFHPSTVEKEPDSKRKFIFYARPNNLRNLFYLGIEVIEAAIAQHVLDPKVWEIIFVGKDIPDIVFGDGHAPTKRENMSWSEYADLAGTMDLGLSLMYTPHPSYPPLDLAASGAVVVTNQFGIKQDLKRYSANLICANADRDALVEALREGVALAMNRPLRQKNFEGNGLCTDWEMSFAETIERIAGKN